MKKTMLTLLTVFLLLSSSPMSRGDPPLPCCDVIQIAASQLQDCSATGQFQPVSVASLESATVTLQFDISLAGTQVVIQPLDGGILNSGGSATIDQDGNLSFPFQVGNQPGLYRVSVVANNSNGSVLVSLVQFQVPNPE